MSAPQCGACASGKHADCSGWCHCVAGPCDREPVSVVHWLAAGDCDAPHGLDMTTEHDRAKVERLVDAFMLRGFDRREPALVGYVKDGRVQLLSGTHRHAAAGIACVPLPVVLWLGSDIEQAWGDLDKWRRVIQDIPVAVLEGWTRADLDARVGP